jgi:glutathione S-transferase/GST-like protein
MLELYHWEPNTYFLKPLIALQEKQVPFTSRWFDPIAFDQFAPSFPKNTESGLHLEREGPLLVHDGTIISNSFFMLEYIAEAFPGPDLLTGDALQHYRARAWGQVLTAVGADVSLLGCAKHLAPVLKKQNAAALKSRLDAIEPLERRLAWSAVADGKYDDTAVAAVRDRLKFSLKRVESALGQSPWLTGSAYSIADIDAFALISPLPDLAPDVVNDTDTPRIANFLHRVRERKAVKEALAVNRSGKPHEAFVPGAEPSRWG